MRKAETIYERGDVVRDSDGDIAVCTREGNAELSKWVKVYLYAPERDAVGYAVNEGLAGVIALQGFARTSYLLTDAEKIEVLR